MNNASEPSKILIWHLNTGTVLEGWDSKTSGIFKYLKIGGARFIKIIVIDVELLDFLKGDFLEVWDIYLVAIISRGSCKF